MRKTLIFKPVRTYYVDVIQISRSGQLSVDHSEIESIGLIYISENSVDAFYKYIKSVEGLHREDAEVEKVSFIDFVLREIESLTISDFISNLYFQITYDNKPIPLITPIRYAERITDDILRARKKQKFYSIILDNKILSYDMVRKEFFVDFILNTMLTGLNTLSSMYNTYSRLPFFENLKRGGLPDE